MKHSIPRLMNRTWARPASGLFAMMMVVSSVMAEPFEFRKNDTVAIVGNGLVDRMQHDPWVETALQHHLKGMNVRFRNMGFAGDMVNRKPRSKGLMR